MTELLRRLEELKSNCDVNVDIARQTAGREIVTSDVRKIYNRVATEEAVNASRRFIGLHWAIGEIPANPRSHR